MRQRSLLECTFFIPERRDRFLSDGRAHKKKAWEWLEGELYGAFKGGTAAPGWYDGFYEDPDTHEMMCDRCRKYIVALRAAQVAELRRFLQQACEVFQQKMIYLSIAGRVEFVERQNREDRETTNGQLS